MERIASPISAIHGISGAAMLHIRDMPLGKHLRFYTANGTAILDIIADAKSFGKGFYHSNRHDTALAPVLPGRISAVPSLLPAV